jgi:hypothetical protein
MENFMEDIVIVAATRTAVGKFGGTLAKTPAPDLGAAVVVELLKRARLSGEQIGELIFGQVLTAGGRPEPGAPDRHQERPTGDRAGAHHQRRLRLRPEGGHARRPGGARRNTSIRPVWSGRPT